MKLDLEKIDPEKAKQVTQLIIEIQELKFDLKQYAQGSREVIKRKEDEIKRLTDTISQGEIFV